MGSAALLVLVAQQVLAGRVVHGSRPAFELSGHRPQQRAASDQQESSAATPPSADSGPHAAEMVKGEAEQKAKSRKDWSWHRKACSAREDLNSWAFPPESHPPESYMYRGSIPGTALGDIHLIVKDVQVTRLDAEISLARKSRDAFAFELHGLRGQPKAVIEAWVEGLDFDMPTSSVDELAKGFAGVESWFGRFAGKPTYGRLDSFKVSVNLSMSGDVRTDKNGNWEVDSSTRQSHADIKLGSGGLLLGVANKILKGTGGKSLEDWIFGLLWPLVMQMLPGWFGQALATVPEKSGHFATKLELETVCRTPAHHAKNSITKRRCPDHLLDLQAKVTNLVTMQASPVLQSMVEQGHAGALGALVEAYKAGRGPVMGGLHGEFSVDVGISGAPGDQALKVQARPGLQAPLSLLAALAPGVRLTDFMPKEGKLSLKGGNLEAGNGMIRVPFGYMDDVHLPVGSGSDTVQIRGTLDEFTVELEDTSGLKFIDKSKLNRTGLFNQLWDLIGEDSPLTVSAPGVTVGLGRGSGLDLAPVDGGDAFAATYAPEGFTKILSGASQTLSMPANVRNDSLSRFDADGPIPLVYQRPHDRPLTKWDFAALLPEGLNVSVGGSVSASREDNELVEVRLSATVAGALRFGPAAWRAMLDAKDHDLGYLHIFVGGYYGEIQSGGARPSRPALLRLSCGSLDMWKLDNSKESADKSEPFSAKPWLSLDLGFMNDLDWQTLKNGAAHQRRSWHCIRVKTSSSWLFSGDTSKFFCADDLDGQRLQEAIKIQRHRFRSAFQRTKDCTGEAWECPARYDGTWFEEYNMYNSSTWQPEFVAPPNMPQLHKSPAQQWESIVKAMKDGW